MKCLRLFEMMLLLAGAIACEKSDDTVGIYQEIRSADKMVFATMAITKTAKTERSDWYKVGKRIAVYSYDTYMQAYIDLSKLQDYDLVFDHDAKTVRVMLPPIETELTGRDMEMRKEYENIGIFRTEIGAKERAEMKELANKSLKKEVAENPMFNDRLKDAARVKARKYFEAIFQARGYRAIIEFKDSSSDSGRRYDGIHKNLD